MILSRLAMFSCIMLAVSACTTPASRPADADVSDTAMAAAEKDPLVCKNVIPAGTRVAQRTCTRQSDLDRAKRDGREMLDEVQRRGVQTGNITE